MTSLGEDKHQDFVVADLSLADFVRLRQLRLAVQGESRGVSTRVCMLEGWFQTQTETTHQTDSEEAK